MPQGQFGSRSPAIPSHMDDNQKIVISGQRRGPRREDQVLKKEESNQFMERMASQVGPAYILAMIAGGFYGGLQIPPAKARRTTRLLINTYINNIGKNSSRFANNTAAAVLLYVMTGKAINWIFLEEFEDFGMNTTVQNIVYGGAAGAIYKSTRGFKPMMLSASLGAILSLSYHYVWSKGFFNLATVSNGMHWGNVEAKC